jgi:quercetin dioxygenase-like cupin family protein
VNIKKSWEFRFMAMGVLMAASVVAVRLFAAGAFPQIVTIAAGNVPNADLKAKVKGPTDVLTAELVFETGGDTGWHIHPGPVAVVVKSGSLTEHEANGCSVFHPTGSAFLEEPGVVHKAVSEAGPSDAIVTFLSPQGMPPLIPVADPGPATCKK